LNIKTEATKVVECHCGLAAYYGDLGKIKSPYERFLKRMQKMKIVRTIRKFDKFVVMTQAELLDWNNDTKAVCIPNMLATFPNIMSNDVRQIKHRINCVGRYAYQKGYDMLIDAWRIVQTKHPDWSLHIYGSRDGDAGDYDQLQYVIGGNDIQNVYLHPATNDVYSKYVDSDFYVISSRYESFGLTLIEAMSCGLPIVSFNCKYGPASIVKDGETGILVSPNDVEKLADAICSMIENKEIRQQMSENARLESKKYLPENIMPLWHEFYKSLGKDHSIDA
jgi:glycosyltransferase involved in cell wall biosynthesis